MPLKEEDIPSSGRIYHDVHALIHTISPKLAEFTLDRIRVHYEMESSFMVSAFINASNFEDKDEVKNLLQSSYYRAKVFNRCSVIMMEAGYEADLSLDENSRSNRIYYKSRVLHPLKKILLKLQPVYAFAFGYATFVAYKAAKHYLNAREQMNHE